MPPLRQSNPCIRDAMIWGWAALRKRTGRPHRLSAGSPQLPDDFPRNVQQLIHYPGDPVEGQQGRAIPGMGSKVPVWLVRSGSFGAQLSALPGLPFAFAAHFSPRLLHEALRLYRSHFQPSEAWPEPYAMVGVPVIAAPRTGRTSRRRN